MLGIVPIGPANDYARTITHKTPLDILNSIAESKGKKVDVVKLEWNHAVRFSMNMAAAGIGAEIAQTVNARKT